MQRALCAVLLAATSAQAQQAERRNDTPEIVAEGAGRVIVKPDRATIHLTVETRAPTAAGAGAENARLHAAVIDTLRRIGFGPDVVSTTRYVVSTDMRYGDGQQRLAGYVARNSVRITVRELARVSDVIDAGLRAGANNIAGVDFRSEREAALQLDALDSAAASARRRAQVLARAAGGKLGPLLELSTTGFRDRQFMGVAAAGAAGRTVETTITPGEITIPAAVVGRWRFVPDMP